VIKSTPALSCRSRENGNPGEAIGGPRLQLLDARFRGHDGYPISWFVFASEAKQSSTRDAQRPQWIASSRCRAPRNDGLRKGIEASNSYHWQVDGDQRLKFKDGIASWKNPRDAENFLRNGLQVAHRPFISRIMIQRPNISLVTAAAMLLATRLWHCARLSRPEHQFGLRGVDDGDSGG
jgi:hypothetical protein